MFEKRQSRFNALVSVAVVMIMSIVNVIALSTFKIVSNKNYSLQGDVTAYEQEILQQSRFDVIDSGIKEVFKRTLLDEDVKYGEKDFVTYIKTSEEKDLKKRGMTYLSNVLKAKFAFKLQYYLASEVPSEFNLSLDQLTSHSEQRIIDFNVYTSLRDITEKEKVYYMVKTPDLQYDDIAQIISGEWEQVWDKYKGDVIYKRLN